MRYFCNRSFVMISFILEYKIPILLGQMFNTHLIPKYNNGKNFTVLTHGIQFNSYDLYSIVWSFIWQFINRYSLWSPSTFFISPFFLHYYRFAKFSSSYSSLSGKFLFSTLSFTIHTLSHVSIKTKEKP